MINRKTFWSVMFLVAVMLAAAAWRVSLLADWTHLPRYGVNGAAMAPINSAILLLMPGMVLFIVARLTFRARTARNQGENLRPWQKWAPVLLLPISLIMALMQGFMITRSLGLLLTLNPILVTRSVLVIAGLAGMVTSNAVPKLPWLGSRIAFLDLGPDKGARFLRFKGWLGVLMGLACVLIGLFLPMRLATPVVLSLTVIAVIVSVAFRFSGRRGQPQ